MATTGRIVGPVCGGLLMESVAPGAPFLAAGAMMLAALAIFRASRPVLVVPEVDLGGPARVAERRAQRAVGGRSSSA
jgi:hypothetical protein